MHQVWDAVRAGQVQWLWVERDYWEPARLAEGGKRLLPAPDLEAPGVTEDMVDLVMERAALSGAHVEIVERLGHGRAGDRIAAQLGAPAGAGEQPEPLEVLVGEPEAGRAAAA